MLYNFKINIFALFVAILILPGCAESIAISLGMTALEALNESRVSAKENPKKTTKNDPKYKDNLRTCLDGGYPRLCKKKWLTTQELERVVKAEKKYNLRTCLDGGYPRLCKKKWLTTQELERVVKAEKKYKKNIESYSNGGLCAENGSCYGDISNLTGKPKTVSVGGYYRSDGTYVRGHYRSK